MSENKELKSDTKTKVKKTELGELPAEWEVVRLGEVATEIKNGFASGKRDENGIVQIRMNNITTDGRLIFDSYLKVPVPKNVNEYLLKEGDFLFNNTNSYDLVGKSALFEGASFPCVFSNHFTRIRFDESKVCPKYISYYFVRLWERGFFKSVAIRHVGQAAVSTKYIVNLKIPLPPLPEQRRIARVLSTVDEAIEKTDAMIAHADKLKKGLMQRLLTRGIGHEEFKDTEIGRIPAEWEVVRLGDVANIRTGPFGAQLKKSDLVEKGIKIYEQENVIKKNFKIGSDYISFEKYKTLKGFTLKEGDILVTRVGTIGSAIVVPANIEKGIFGSRLLRIRLNTTNIKPEFLVLLFKFDNIQLQITRKSHGATRKGLNTRIISSIKLPLPPLEEQKKIAEILGTVDRKLELLRARRERLERVKRGLMNDLLTGRKRVPEGVV